jgi:hypothetical protein
MTGKPEFDRNEGSRWIISALPTIRELLYLMDASAFIGTNPQLT